MRSQNTTPIENRLDGFDKPRRTPCKRLFQETFSEPVRSSSPYSSPVSDGDGPAGFMCITPPPTEPNSSTAFSDVMNTPPSPSPENCPSAPSPNSRCTWPSAGKRPRTQVTPELFVENVIDEQTEKLSIEVDENAPPFVAPCQRPLTQCQGMKFQSCNTIRSVRTESSKTPTPFVAKPPTLSFTAPRFDPKACKTPVHPSARRKMSPSKSLQVPFNMNPWSPSPADRKNSMVNTPHFIRNPISSSNLFETCFKQQETIGSGSFGTVYRCIHIVDGVEYAVKAVPLKGNRDLRYKLKEVYALSAIPGHPNLVRYYNSWVHCDSLYIQLEYCGGGNLEQAKRVYDERELFGMIRQLSSGLACLHSFDMVHEDVKPENIYLMNVSHGGEVTVRYKIGDFGLIKHLSGDDFDEDGQEGDSRYLAKEVLNGSLNSSDPASRSKSDIFSLGLTIYQLATQRKLPSHGEEWENLRKGSLEFPENFSPEFCNLVNSMVHPDPRLRPSANALFYHPKVFSSNTSDYCSDFVDQIDLVQQNERLKEENRDLRAQIEGLKAMLGKSCSEKMDFGFE
jgi:hypothetical protein